MQLSADIEIKATGRSVKSKLAGILRFNDVGEIKSYQAAHDTALLLEQIGYLPTIAVTERDGLGVVERFHRALQQKDMTNLAACLAENASLQVPGQPTAEGKNAVIQTVQQISNTIPDLTITVHELMMEGNAAVARITWNGTEKGTLGLFPASNKPITIPALEMINLDQNGLITSARIYFDRGEVLRQTGVLPA
jgi:steroid delta-isomerase-like uncharacterized protein